MFIIELRFIDIRTTEKNLHVMKYNGAFRLKLHVYTGCIKKSEPLLTKYRIPPRITRAFPPKMYLFKGASYTR